MSRATQGTARLRLASDTGLSPATARLSRRFSSQDSCHVAALLPRRGRNLRGLGCAPFARHYWGYHCCFLFLRVLRCFSSPGLPLHQSRYQVFNLMGCPIRKSRDQRSFAPTPSLSQLVTSFIACESQGIRHAPFITFSHKKLGRIYFQLLASMIVKLLFVVCNLIKEKLMKFSSLYICFRIIMSKISSGIWILSTVNSQLTMSSRMGVHRNSNAVPK